MKELNIQLKPFDIIITNQPKLTLLIGNKDTTKNVISCILCRLDQQTQAGTAFTIHRDTIDFLEEFFPKTQICFEKDDIRFLNNIFEQKN